MSQFDSSAAPGVPLRWAVAGTGQISRSVVPDLQMLPGHEIVRVQSRDSGKAAAFAKEFGINSWSSEYSEVLADNSVDVIYLATPIATHHALAREALEAGKHLLIEKPIATSAAEAEELFTLAQERGLFIMEAMWTKFNPGFRRMIGEVRSGRIGEPRSVRASFGAPFPKEQWPSKWDMQRSGGALLDQGIYPVTLAHEVMGEPESVHASGQVTGGGLDESEHFTLEFSNGRFAQGAASLTDFIDLSASVNGTLGWIAIPAPFWASTSFAVHTGESPEKLLTSPDHLSFEQEGNGYVPMLRAVGEAITSGLLQHPVHTGKDTVAVFRTLDTIRQQLAALSTTL